MMEPPRPENEAQRLEALHALDILDSDPEETFDRIAHFAARLFDAPIAAVSLIDEHRVWFKARCGLEDTEGDRRSAFCAHTILTDDVLVVEDTAEDPRFRGDPKVTAEGTRFYAGAD